MAYTGAPWHWWSAAYGRGHAVYRRRADGCGRGVWPHRMAYRQVDPDGSPCGGTAWTCALQKEAAPALDRSQGGFHPRFTAWRIDRAVPSVGQTAHIATAPRPWWPLDRTRRGPARARTGPMMSMPAAPVGCAPSLASRNRASAGFRAGGAWPPAMTHTRIVAWVFCTGRRFGSG